MMFTKEEDIIHFLFIAFKDKKRVKEDIEMVYHSIMVGNMLKNEDCDLTTILIGYLHDVIEDTNYDYNYLKEHYGQEIADGVLMVSDDKSIADFRIRKSMFIEKIWNANRNIIMVELADKLQNLLSDYSLFLTKGKEYLNTEAGNYEEVKWYYEEFQKLFNAKLNCPMLKRYNEIMNIYFG